MTHIKLIARQHVKYSVRGGAGLVFVFIALLTGLIVASVFISPIEELARQSGESTGKILDEVVEEIGLPAIEWALDTDGEQARYLALEQPAIVSAFVLLFTMFWPFLIALGAFNQTSGDIGNRGLRYLLLRTERFNIYMGRFIGTYLYALAVLAVIFGVVLLYLVIKADFYPPGDVFLSLGRAYLVLAVYTLPWVALSAWISAAIDSPFAALVLIMLIIGLWPLLIMLGKGIQDWVAYGSYLSPWGFKFWLFSPDPARVLGACGIMVAFAGLFTFLGKQLFDRRDL